MRLIATMGATGIDKKHIYKINNKEFKKELSFLALAEAYNIKDIVLIGTKVSENKIKPILNNNPNIKMVVIESVSVEEVFEKSLEYLDDETILDLTQGFRHYPMLTLLATIFKQSDKKNIIKDIYYAQTLDEKCNPRDDECRYKFESLIKYVDIANMARVINTFNKTLLTLDYKVQNKEFENIQKTLSNLTKGLFSNDFRKSKKYAKNIAKNLEKILESGELNIIKSHLNSLLDEMKKIEKLSSKNESQTLLNVAEYFVNKKILLHSLTLLYESMVAYLDEKVNIDRCNNVEKKGKIQKANTYERRNCLKKQLGKCEKGVIKNNISKCKDFSKNLRLIDKLRNTAAHAHTSGSYQEDLEKEIKEVIKFLKPIYSDKKEDKIESLKDMFNNR